MGWFTMYNVTLNKINPHLITFAITTLLLVMLSGITSAEDVQSSIGSMTATPSAPIKGQDYTFMVSILNTDNDEVLILHKVYTYASGGVITGTSEDTNVIQPYSTGTYVYVEGGPVPVESTIYSIVYSVKLYDNTEEVDSSGPLTVVFQSITPQEQIQQMITSIQDLVTSGVLNKGNGNALISKLDAAKKNINTGNKKAAVNELNAFINQINAFKGKQLSSTEADTLISEANDVIKALQTC
jgi:hypothetical protein